MINHDMAAVKEFIFCTWPQIRMERLFLQLIKKKLTRIDKFPPANYLKTLNPLPFCLSPLLKSQKKIPPLTCPVWNPGSPPFTSRVGVGLGGGLVRKLRSLSAPNFILIQHYNILIQHYLKMILFKVYEE